MSSGSSGKSVIVPEPSRSIFCLMRRILLLCVGVGKDYLRFGRVLFKEVVVSLEIGNIAL